MRKSVHQLKAFLTVLAVLAALLLGSVSPASASAPTQSTAVVTTQAAPAAVGTVIDGTKVCGGLVSAGYKSIYVAAAAIGFCPTWGFFQTGWGRQVGNWVTNVGCRMPWFVWAATGGRWTKC
jgi:hypothetical protein